MQVMWQDYVSKYATFLKVCHLNTGSPSHPRVPHPLHYPRLVESADAESADTEGPGRDLGRYQNLMGLGFWYPQRVLEPISRGYLGMTVV